MVLLGMLYAALFVFSANSHDQQAIFDSIQDKFEYRNLFDTCINNKDIFESLRDNDNVAVYTNYLNASSALLKKSFKIFIERNKSEALDYTRFRRLKGLAYAYSLIYSADLSVDSVIYSFKDDYKFFFEAFKQALKKERKMMLTNFNEFSAISKIFNYEIVKMQGNYRAKDCLGEAYSKDIEKPLRRFCKYAHLMNTCYFLAL